MKDEIDKHGAPADWNEYKKIRNRVFLYTFYSNKHRNNLNKNFCPSKRNYYIKELNDYSNDIKMTWKTLKNFCPSNKDSTIKIQQNDKLLCDPFEVACIFNEYFTRNNGIDSTVNETEMKAGTIKFKFNVITEEFVTKELKLLSRNKSPGPDQLNPSLLKDGAPLTHLLNTSLKSGHTPRDWKRARITPIFKDW